ncbi:phosphatase 2C-like domain-containing protein [Absidia repens]|uniref:protein-serine/threonine phosphatase n=1 Tax=Absidia repens TaxID=90262 RepID=A0A1X2INS2_9FUNG|nr:phosphatase 2C-like domain-containing protein [Absidia repens]
MGQALSEPVTTKTSSEGSTDKSLVYSVSSMQGWRVNMEDRHALIPSYEDTGDNFFAVFDGHGVGDSVAEYCSEHLHHRVFHSQAYKDGHVQDALRWANLQVDKELRIDVSQSQETAGCTALAALITKDNHLYISNAGDSRAVLSTKNGKAMALSKDHKPNDPIETERIKLAGGHVEGNRVNGTLALSRAIGDFGFKTQTDIPPEKQAVTAYPDIQEYKLTPDDEFLVLACDGIWDCRSDQQVVDIIRYGLTLKKTLVQISEELMDTCLAEHNTASVGCDNMTLIIVAFLHNNKDVDEWYDTMASNQISKPSSLCKQQQQKPSKLPPSFIIKE